MKKSFGFNLIEMAMVLVIVGLLMNSILIPLPSQIDQKKIVATKEHLEEIKEALLGFAVLHDRLPYPAESFREDEIIKVRESILFDFDEAYLPWINLGVGRYDAWGNSFRYRVRCFLNWNPNCSILVKDAISDLDLIRLQGDYSAIIFSKGKNAEGDKKNDNSDRVYSQGDHVEVLDVNKYFDDILIWLPENIVVNRLVTVGKWQWAPP
jgi:prepilin-type N-terminal cleavage/methylation domain-containing protein